MYKIVFYSFILILTISTLCIYILKPRMHKTVMIYNSDYKIVVNTPEVETVRNIPTQVNIPTVEQKTTKIQQKNQNATSVNQVTQNVKTKPVTTSQNIQQVKENKVTIPQSIQKVVNTEIQTQKQAIKEEIQTQRELILWNKWRSNIQNSIMNDVKLPIIQEGIIFRFSFDVDKYGKISNVKTWSLNPTYTPYAIQYIAPVIKSYQGRSILEFPTGSNRFSTTVEGGWKISKIARYSTPEDYKDTEKVDK